jgi:hypothetical protein
MITNSTYLRIQLNTCTPTSDTTLPIVQSTTNILNSELELLHHFYVRSTVRNYEYSNELVLVHTLPLGIANWNIIRPSRSIQHEIELRQLIALRLPAEPT